MRRHIVEFCEQHDLELIWCRRPMDDAPDLAVSGI
jgi:hypothetical protein